MTGVYINCRLIPFIMLILAGVKHHETRTRDVFKALYGQRVALIETGRGPVPMVRGYATIGRPRRVPYSDTDAREAAQILGTPYDIQPGAEKVFYPLVRVRRCRPYPLLADHVNHGRSYCTFTKPGKGGATL